MGKIDESTAGTYDWENGDVYLIERSDRVEGGEDGISNRQGKAMAIRTRNLHDRLTALKQQAADIAAELEALTGAVDTKDAATLSAAQLDASTKTEAALRSAKEYTDTREGIVRSNYATADSATLVSANSYADQVVAALVDGSPEAINTLQELAAALGNDPNFATTVMQLIGERATTEAMNAALAGKANLNGEENTDFVAKNVLAQRLKTYSIVPNNYAYVKQANVTENTSKMILGSTYGYDAEKDAMELFNGNVNFLNNAAIQGNDLWHTGNLKAATAAAAGLMSAADKTKLDAVGVTSKCCGMVYSGGMLANGHGCTSAARIDTGKYRIYHDIGHADYAVTVTITPGGGNTYDNTPMIASINPGSFDVWIGTGPGSLEDTEFCFITMPYR